ncbi:hypothetical protein L6452_17145 [Arctium lappa]|uniref:Uncharacterized protein n=1 Tax=Arctium lappa TaxID=4217 RepID=A0ACB9C2U0_ARCLA|nr:hypothetical protein L6452_17145 [Arctium lappa]
MVMILMRMDKPMIFARSVLLSIDAKEGIKLAIIMHMKAMLPNLVAWSTLPRIRLVRSTGNFMATVITVIDTALREKYLHGNQIFLFRKPCNKSAAMARMQKRDAIAM